MILTIVILIFIYLAVGIYKVVSDFRICRPENRPMYVFNPKLTMILFAIIMWLPMLVMELKRLGINRLLLERRKLRKSEKVARLESKLMRNPRNPITFLKYGEALEEAVKEMNKDEQNKEKSSL